jgi:hypothetical protein
MRTPVALDEAVWILEQRAGGELEVQPARVRDQREQQVAHCGAPADREEAVAAVEVNHRARGLLEDDPQDLTRRALDVRRVASEDLVPGLGLGRLVERHLPEISSTSTSESTRTAFIRRPV